MLVVNLIYLFMRACLSLEIDPHFTSKIPQHPCTFSNPCGFLALMLYIICLHSHLFTQALPAFLLILPNFWPLFSEFHSIGISINVPDFSVIIAQDVIIYYNMF